MMLYSCFQDMIENLIKEGIEVTIKYDKEKSQVYYDLNTGMKSHLHIWYDRSNDSCVYEGRYSVGMVADYEHLLWCAKNCLHGRDFMNLSWCELLQKEGILKVNKVTTTTYS